MDDLLKRFRDFESVKDLDKCSHRRELEIKDPIDKPRAFVDNILYCYTYCLDVAFENIIVSK